jgi:ABC-type polysaccharide/polyol phosphate transport system ATPase subunit
VSDLAVAVSGLQKVFKIPFEHRTRLRDHVVHLFRSPGHRRLEALKNVDLEVRSGEFFGIIGRNGSGKSTLLKVLAGIYQPSQGKVRISGRLSPFIELGVGFNPELSARDNIFLNGAILGLDRKQVAAQFDEIISFAELEDFVDQKLKNFSSGMLVRLAFSVAIRAHADILLIDEVLAVGDFEFQQKCFNVFRQLKAEGRTIIFVSHDLSAISEFSDRVMILDRGVVRGIYGPGQAISEYHRLIEARVGGPASDIPDSDQGRETSPSVQEVLLLDKRGEPTHVLHRGDEVTVAVTVHNGQGIEVNVGIALYRSDGLYCFGTNMLMAGIPSRFDKSFVAEARFSAIALQRGSYYLLVGLLGDSASTVYEVLEHAWDFQVVQDDDYEGVGYQDHSWRLSEQRSG